MRPLTFLIVWPLFVLSLGGSFLAYSGYKQRVDNERDYPYQWKSLRREWFGCPDLTGSYQFKGDGKWIEHADPYNGEPLIAFIGYAKFRELTQLTFKAQLDVQERRQLWDVADRKITHIPLRALRMAISMFQFGTVTRWYMEPFSM